MLVHWEATTFSSVADRADLYTLIVLYDFDLDCSAKKAVITIRSLDLGSESLTIHKSAQFRQALSYALVIFALMAPMKSSTTSPEKPCFRRPP
jgi:hypothetical protein